MEKDMQREYFSLENWIGERVLAVIPMLNPDGREWVTIRNVEAGGIWIDSERLTVGFCTGNSEHNELDEVAKVVAFVPYSQILFLTVLENKSGRPTKIIPFGGKVNNIPVSADEPTQDIPPTKEK